MAKDRAHIPRTVRDQVMGEFNHRCAKCGADHPHLHHIDEDPSNNDPMNLIPLRPNCHLIDQHNPTQRIEPERLMLFRKYKDPAILTPQFHAHALS
jgi:5-methylcytosine-specific restriction endonuclease McrA